MRRINETSRLHCKTIIIGYLYFCLLLLFIFVYNENTNYWIWITQYFHSSQLCDKLQNLCQLGAAATCKTIVFIFY